MKHIKLGLVLAFCIGLVACQPGGGGGITGGTVTVPDKSATLTIPADTFSTPVAISIERETIPVPDPLEYTGLGQGFRLNAPSEFSATKDAILDIQGSALTVAGKPLTPQNVPADAVLVALVKRPTDSSYRMLPMIPSSEIQTQAPTASWRIYLDSYYICRFCTIIAVVLRPNRIEINAPNPLAEGAAAKATITAFNKLDEPALISYIVVNWSSSDPSVASIDSTGLLKGEKIGTTTISAQASSFNAQKVVNVVASAPVLFAANYNAGTIKGYSKGQAASSGTPAPLVTITLPAGTKPNDLAFDPSGNLWVSDNADNANRLLRLTPAQLQSTGSPTPDVIISAAYVNSIAGLSLEKPVAMTFDSSGNLWVSSTTNRVVRFAASSLAATGSPQPDRAITQNMNFPSGVAVDGSSNLWVANYSGNTIARFTPSEQQNNTAPSYVLNAGLTNPVGLEFDTGGNLYVGKTSGVGVFTSSQLSAAPTAPSRTIGAGTIFGLAIDASNGTLWANSQAVGTAISYTLNQLASGTGATTPNVAVSGATEANIGYGGVAFAGGGTAPAPKPVISSFTVTPPNLGVGGGNVTLAWNVTGATSLSIDQGVGVVTGSSTTRNVSSTTTFTLTATNANGSTLSSPTTVTVAVPVGNPVENDTSFTVTGLGTTQTRTSKYRVSGQPTPANGRPLVIFLHGNGGVINQVPQDYKTWTDQQAAVLVAPQGLLDNGVTSWRFRMDGKNDAGTAAGVDDVAFIQEIITRATSAANPLFGAGNKVDPNKVFVVGESRGAGMAYYLYADPRTKNLISAIAPISGTFYCATSNGGNGNVPYNPPADSDFNCGENGGFGFFGPKASLYARATPPRLFNIHGTNDLASTPAPALNNEYGSLILMTKQWATTANNCGTSLPAANPVFSNANIAGKTVTAYRQRNQANNAPCPADVTFFIVQDGGHVPQGYAERIVKWFFGQYNTQTNVFN